MLVGDQGIVQQGKVVTAAGVSAGLDMALWLAGRIGRDAQACAIQPGIEYDPQPPYDMDMSQKRPRPSKRAPLCSWEKCLQEQAKFPHQ